MNTVCIVIIGALCFLLQLAGYFSPGWIRFSSLGVVNIDMGLWYGCLRGDCVSYISLEKMAQNEGTANRHVISSWLEYQIEATIGAIAAIIGFSLTCVFCNKTPEESKTMRIISAIAFLVSGIAAWIPAGKFAQLYSNLSYFTDMAFPYSVVLTGFGASLALLNAILIGVLVYRSSHQQAGYVV